MTDNIDGMANELLDFVMSLVRDPDAAARYAENPQQAIADAHLTDVTSVDVNNLIPVVSESLSMASPAHGAADDNVWSSGAATAAFDAFGDHQPAVDAAVVHEPVIDASAPASHDPGPDLDTFDNPLDQPFVPAEVEVHDVAPIVDPGGVDPVFDHAVDEHHVDDHHDHHGFDGPLF